jgi:hypothetical protein
MSLEHVLTAVAIVVCFYGVGRVAWWWEDRKEHRRPGRAPWWRRGWCYIRRKHGHARFAYYWYCSSCGDLIHLN